MTHHLKVRFKTLHSRVRVGARSKQLFGFGGLAGGIPTQKFRLLFSITQCLNCVGNVRVGARSKQPFSFHSGFRLHFSEFQNVILGLGVSTKSTFTREMRPTKTERLITPRTHKNTVCTIFGDLLVSRFLICDFNCKHGA